MIHLFIASIIRPWGYDTLEFRLRELNVEGWCFMHYRALLFASQIVNSLSPFSALPDAFDRVFYTLMRYFHTKTNLHYNETSELPLKVLIIVYKSFEKNIHNFQMIIFHIKQKEPNIFS